MLTDPVADMLTRIRNANKALQDRVVMPFVQVEGRDRPPAQGRGLRQGLHVERGESFDHLVSS
jgi:small subunit ribosomal protein S8